MAWLAGPWLFGGFGSSKKDDHFDRDKASLWDKLKHDAGNLAGGLNPANWWNYLTQNWVWLLLAAAGALILVVMIYFLVR